ncbi:RNA-binding domain-containing protein [Enterococcus columbae]|uniref:Schlafen AlbA-2 domain-containing protein n=1 Tax=Enterococcus columbae DSM 7374 = ATCC 51263 TaxID=1121865 RepID=S0KDV0_9ENTE|nr:RNA-binding domain-containing protein [Enterococcus columbae]EOT39115.1 hypothetical protein OMW_01992 [Enterococcus columbae DSM 7374 = ATCC 51263]EOW79952.1 hypothetical protein I568_02303 [Enterococcus columbae DSM 7374 = ATCC 51263]OJG24021.1 hypothetical protein RR47_GL000430 [Enterococcus columbae DSM 7374 = ATCC 51263]
MNILQPEGRYVEYKAAKNDLPNDLWETYSAFANTQGGKIILGISEVKKRKYEVTGVINPEKRIDKFWQLVTNPQKVSVNLLDEQDIQIIDIEGKQVIEINVPEANYYQKPIYINGHKEMAYKRIGEEDKQVTDEEYKYMIVNSHDGIDNVVLKHFDIDDLNKKDILAYRSLLIEVTGEEKYADMSLQELLINLGVMKRDRLGDKKSYGLTLGGLLFFGKYNSIVEYYPNFQLDYLKKATSFEADWQDRISIGDKDYPDMNIFSFYMKVLDKLILSVENRFHLNEKMARDSYYNDISKAIREALTNSIVHAYYGSSDTIKIIDYDDYWEFYNPGDMKVTKEEFIHGGTSRVRNSVISILFRRIGFVERAGSGGPRIFDAVSRHRLKIPEIYSTDKDTTIRIWKFEPMSYYKTRSLEEQKLLKEILQSGSVTKSMALVDLKMTEHAYRTAINTLLEDQIIKKIGKSRNTKYVISYSEEGYIQSRKKWLVEYNDRLKNT